MITLNELDLNEDIRCFMENLMRNKENIKDEDDLIKLFRNSVKHCEYDKIINVMINGDYTESALNMGGYGGVSIIPYLMYYDLIWEDIETLLNAIDDSESTIYKSLQMIQNDYMECDFIRKFYPESSEFNYTPEDLFEVVANIEEMGLRLEQSGIRNLEDKQRCVRRFMEVTEVVLHRDIVKQKVKDKRSLEVLERLRKLDYSDFKIKNGQGEFELKSKFKDLYDSFFDILENEYIEVGFTEGLEDIKECREQIGLEKEKEIEDVFER